MTKFIFCLFLKTGELKDSSLTYKKRKKKFEKGEGKRRKEMVKVRRIFCFVLVGLLVTMLSLSLSVLGIPDAKAEQIVYYPGQSVVGIQNAVFGSRFNVNKHYDWGRRKVWTSTMGSMMDDKTSFIVATRSDSDGSVMRFAPSDQGYPEYWYHVMDLDANTYQANGAHVRNGATPGVASDIILEVNEKTINHFVPSTSLEDSNLKISIAPFFFEEITVTNRTDGWQSGELLVSVDYAIGYNQVGDTKIIYYQTASDRGGIRALAIKDPSASWGIGTRIFGDFAASGRLINSSQPDGIYNAGGFVVPFNLGPHQSVKKVLVYAGYYGGNAMIDQRTGRGLKFYYTKFFRNVEEVINYAFSNYGDIVQKANNFSAKLRTGNPSLDFAVSQGIHSYMANTWLLYDPVEDRPRFYVSEGSCHFLSTIDVAYETAMFEAEYIPWALKLQLEEWSEYVLRDDYGAYLQHDMGVGTEVRDRQAYLGEMKVEEIVDYILILFLFWKRTGDTGFVSSKMPLVREFLASLQRRDTDGNGIVDKEAGYTTFDFDWGHSALAIGQENVYLAIKELSSFLVAEQFERTIGRDGSAYRQYAGKISETLKGVYQKYGRLPVSTRDIFKIGWADHTIVNFEGLLYFIITGTEDPLIDDLLCVVAPSHIFALQNCGLRLTSSSSATWLSKTLNAKIINDYFIVRGFYSYEDSIFSEITDSAKEMQLGWTDFDQGGPILYLYPRGAGPATAIVSLMDDFVELEYKTWLHRPSDAGGKNFYFDLLRSGALTVNQMTQSFRHSHEYVWDTPFEVNGVKCRGYVDFAFTWWFGHHQDEEGHNYFCNLITSGEKSDTCVFWEFYRASVVIKAYRELLYRDPDPGGFSCYLEHMRDHGWTEAQVRQSIMDSPEYRQKHFSQ